MNQSGPFDFSNVERKAQALAAQPYARGDNNLPAAFSALGYEQYREIRHRKEATLWREEKLPFQVQLFHRGFMFRERVDINQIDQGAAQRLPYTPELFDFGTLTLPAATDMGFAGFKLLFPLARDENFQEIVVFLGGSHFRAAGLEQSLGLSARGLAVDAGLAKMEELPAFREFWLEKPAADADQLIVYALLDGPSLSGAYRLAIRAGLELSIAVTAHLYFRNTVERLGIAPLNSMFDHGENTSRPVNDYRPEVHDSDGLLLASGENDWQWRPLDNPRKLRIGHFPADNPVGFGLMKRDRNFDHYQDLEARYHRRPSVWVERQGEWGPGKLTLIEIPRNKDPIDNIVAFWTPENRTGAGKDFSLQYRLHFTMEDPPAPPLGRVAATRVDTGGKAGARRFMIDFQGGALPHLSPAARIEGEVSATFGRPENARVQKNLETGGWRLSFELTPEKSAPRPVELRARLKTGHDVLTETWLYPSEE